ncbi:copper homeostasis protein CutC [Xinfangfangia pollutisoli]|uniref:copper homeostasis protein CutC n=1 Tax=Xinfangfangia pollutisoli TaxID=2865960 RepID=UPI001CD5BC99|nr:copper homeostasis protein CutC [Xinfangfangia pollutisoli]
MGLTLEVCVDDPTGLAAAVQGGADRIELCAALALGGLTPSAGFMAQAAGCGVPVLAMIRPRPGDFVFSARAEAVMRSDIDMARQAGLSGVVLGANLPDGRLDLVLLRRLVAAAQGLDLTLHRSFDLTPDLDLALDQAIELGFRRVLTSGGAVTAAQGLARLQALRDRAAGRIAILPGAGIGAANAALFRAAGFDQLHASCSAPWPAPPDLLRLGFAAAGARRTDAAAVRALRAALD